MALVTGVPTVSRSHPNDKRVQKCGIARIKMTSYSEIEFFQDLDNRRISRVRGLFSCSKPKHELVCLSLSFSVLYFCSSACLRSFAAWSSARLKQIIQPKEDGHSWIMESSVICTLHWILLGWSDQGGAHGRGPRKLRTYTKFWSQ
jgi:hypothetical protein